MTGAHVRSVEFADCELGSLQRTGEKISRTRFSDCQLVGARFEDVTLDHVIFADGKMDYAMLSRIRAAGPVMFAACSFREAEFDGCALTGSLFTRCDLARAGFGPGRLRPGPVRPMRPARQRPLRGDRDPPPQEGRAGPRSAAAARRGARRRAERDLRRQPGRPPTGRCGLRSAVTGAVEAVARGARARGARARDGILRIACRRLAPAARCDRGATFLR